MTDRLTVAVQGVSRLVHFGCSTSASVGLPSSRSANLAFASACGVPSDGYTKGMKTAISLPDAVFRAAERHAKRSRKSRSQLYAEALAEYLSRHAPEEVTEAMNQVVDQLDADRDPFVQAAAHSVLQRSEW
jgi:hypothetical protein